MTKGKPHSAGSLVRRPLLAAVLAASAVVPAPAMAAVDIFLKLDTIDGESMHKGHFKWIELESYETGFDNGVRRTFGGGGVAGKPVCSALGAVKQFDAASPKLMAAVMTGKHFQKAELHFARTGDAGEVFLKYELTDVALSSLGNAAVASAAQTRPTESLSLNFSKASVTYYMQDEKGVLTPSVTESVDCGP
jgi:type VI secretion system secreted protein Hcp